MFDNCINVYYINMIPTIKKIFIQSVNAPVQNNMNISSSNIFINK